ncbi:MFS general substrate transporter [Stereum hirsutum FP-91666 SS1]|uniref:MFS general substrate transporter n=1 Tax=Stereum hirsutum (strain FP-91666) TaxID=721885 RepID=R7RYJ2_STEHR|nr:MFS general substrate transporter [Stereum hirsutum FP-91666 SS1]EIM79402.1 MFS general substrate transporter [Stereum hirsutum FP-91666 SS1]
MSTKSLNESDPNDLGGHEKNLNLKVLDAAEVEDIAVQDGVSAIYEAKCRLINDCLQNEVGFGAYQFQLFLLTGLGWMADNIWLQGVAIILPQVQLELNPVRVEFATLSLYVGLILGATTWGILADIIGRKPSFNITLFIAGVFGIAAGGANDFTTLGALIACLGFGVGGNLPVDGALFLEHIPKSHQWLLTLLSAWWALGQLFASLVAWPLITHFSCATAETCTKGNNMGWRYTLYVLGGVTFVMWILRYLVFDLQESSKYLIAKGRDEDAIQVLQNIARRNGRTMKLTVEDLRAVAGGASGESLRPTTLEIIKKSVSGFSLSHVKPLFQTRRLAVNTSITIMLWGLIGLAYPLFNGFITLYLNTHVTDAVSSTSLTYRNYAIISVCGVPGSILACLVVDYTRKDRGDGKNRFAMGGRKLTMAVSTALTGIFLFLFTTSTKEADVLGFSCASGLTQNAMYGVLYAYTPEVFPAPHRGTGDALCSSFNRITGILAPVIKIATTPASGTGSSSTANGPIFVSASLFIAASALMLLLPIETAGKAAL